MESPAPGVRPDPSVRRKLSGPALRTFFNIAAAWELTVQEQRALLGWPAASTFHKYKAGDFGALSFDTLTRLSLVIGIYKDLQILYPEPEFADRWVRMPNSHELFGGRPALTLMADGGIDGLYPVRRLIAGGRGAGNCRLGSSGGWALRDSCPAAIRPSVSSIASRLPRISTPSSNSKAGRTIASTVNPACCEPSRAKSG